MGVPSLPPTSIVPVFTACQWTPFRTPYALQGITAVSTVSTRGFDVQLENTRLESDLQEKYVNCRRRRFLNAKSVFPARSHNLHKNRKRSTQHRDHEIIATAGHSEKQIKQVRTTSTASRSTNGVELGNALNHPDPRQPDEANTHSFKPSLAGHKRTMYA